MSHGRVFDFAGIAVPLDEANIDTNQICPTRFNKVPKGPRFAQVCCTTGASTPTARKSPTTSSIRSLTGAP